MCYARSILYGLFLPKWECFTHSTGTLQWTFRLPNVLHFKISNFGQSSPRSVPDMESNGIITPYYTRLCLLSAMMKCMSGVHWNTNLADSAGCRILRAGAMWGSKFLFSHSFLLKIPCNELLIYILVINFQYDSCTPCIVSMFLVMFWSSMLSFVWVIVLVTKISYIHHESYLDNNNSVFND
jgi:hypothetical protein